MFNGPLLFALFCIGYIVGSSFLSTHQLGGSAGAESGASLQAFLGEYQRNLSGIKAPVSLAEHFENDKFCNVISLITINDT